MLGMDEAHGQEHEIGGQLELATRDTLEATAFELHAHAVELFDLAVAADALGGYAPITLSALFVGRRGTQLQRPKRPGRRSRALIRRSRHDLEARDAEGALTMRGPDAVATRVTAADHDHVLAGGQNGFGVRHRHARHAAVLLRQEIHSEVSARQIAAGYLEIARLARADCEHRGVEVLLQIVRGHVATDVDSGLEDDALSRHLGDAAVDQRLFHLEIGDAVREEPPDAIVALEQRDVVPGARQLLRCRHARRTGADHGDLLTGAGLGEHGFDQAFVERAIGDRALDQLDAHGLFVDPEHARRLARRRTHATSELREVVGRVERRNRELRLVLVGVVVPVWDQVAERATGIAEGDAAIYTARALQRERLLHDG